MGQLKFRMISFTPVEIERWEGANVGQWVDGYWVKGTPIKKTVHLKVQHMKQNEVVLEPEALRNRELLRVYCNDSNLLIADTRGDTSQGDRFWWNGHQYEMVKDNYYIDSVLDHYKGVAARVENTPNNKMS